MSKPDWDAAKAELDDIRKGSGREARLYVLVERLLVAGRSESSRADSEQARAEKAEDANEKMVSTVEGLNERIASLEQQLVNVNAHLNDALSTLESIASFDQQDLHTSVLVLQQMAEITLQRIRELAESEQQLAARGPLPTQEQLREFFFVILKSTLHDRLENVLARAILSHLNEGGWKE